MTAIERRVADVIRYGIYLQENSPPGIYLVADVEGGRPRIVVKDGKHDRTGDDASESVTAVETSSAASERTVEGSDCSESFVTARVKAMKFSEAGPTSRVEHDPPEIIGSYGALIYTDAVIQAMQNNHRDKQAMYLLQITININGRDMVFRLQADTGASTTWLFHRNVCHLKEIIDKWDRTADVPCKLLLLPGSARPRGRPALPPSYMPRYVGRFIPKDLPMDKAHPVHAPFHYPRISYGSGEEILVVGPMSSPVDFKIEIMHNWFTSGPDDEEDLDARFSFAICDAATEPILKDLRMDGLIGFSPEFTMSAFTSGYRHEQDYGLREYPSFSTALQSRLTHISGKEGGIILYFYLNPPEVDQGYSFLAFNVFPDHLLHRSISWTPPIYDTGPLNSRSRYWVIVVKKILIRLMANNEDKARGYEDKDVVIEFGTEGERFQLDTGASTSTFPVHAVDALRDVFDASMQYIVPEWVDLRRSKIQYTIHSKGSPDVVFETSARRFLCDKYRQGLIWDSSLGPEFGYILGLNFYHSAVVALHRPRLGAGPPYIRLGAMVRRAD